MLRSPRSLGRIRTLFALLALALAVPLGLLLDRAFESVEAERDQRHRVVASRIFDEMERELGEVLRREEERPYDHYRTLAFSPETGGLVLSPLATGADLPFVVGTFQVDPDGTVTSPRWPGDPDSARRFGWEPAAEERAPQLAELAEAWRAAGRRDPEVGGGASAEAGDDDRPGAGGRSRIAAEPGAGTSSEPERADARTPVDPGYSVLQQLNRAGIDRLERKTKVAPTQRSQAAEFAARDREAAADEAARTARPGDVVDVRLEPMVGRPVPPDRMLLYRTVVLGERAFRQGLLLSVPRLVDWLEDRVLAGVDPEGAVALRVGRAAAGDRVAVPHRFADPFGAVEVTLVLDPLPESGGVRSLEVLAVATVALAATVFLALYRMMVVTLRFARRRQDFVSAVTHELKTPLTAIRLHAEMLRDGIVSDPGKRQRAYSTLTSEADRLSRLVENVLELARLEQGRRRISTVEGDLRPAIEEVVRLLGPHAERSGFTLRTELPDAPVRARFERDALLQVLYNLVDNALKYGDGGDGRREVTLSCREEESGMVLSVADRGPGVSRRLVGRIFEPFFRGGEELRRTAPGTGIGLALVRHLAEAMGATVGARNRAEGGLVVEVRLAAAADPPATG